MLAVTSGFARFSHQGDGKASGGRFLMALVLACVWAVAFPGPAQAGTDDSPRLVLFAPDARSRSTADLLSDPGAAAVLARGVDQAVLENVPLSDGTTADFAIERFQPFPSSARITVTDGVAEHKLPLPELATYRGQNSADPSQTVYVGVTPEGEVTLIVSGGGKSVTSILPLDAEGRGRGTDAPVSYRISEPSRPKGEEPFCRTIPSGEALDSLSGGGAAPEGRGAARAKWDQTITVRCTVDVSQALYKAFGSNQQAVSTYVANLFAATNTIYQRDLNVRLIVNEVVIWTSRAPFTDADSETMVQRYGSYCRNNRPRESADLFHLLDASPDANRISGIATIGGICTYGRSYGLSRVARIVDFDMLVVAHEIGHNCGSEHTHCYSPPIDCCSLECPGSCSEAAPVKGTLMSYCQDIDASFHPRCVSTMRFYLESLSCLSSGAQTRVAPAQKLRVAAFGTGYQEMVYNAQSGAVTISPYSATSGSVEYPLPASGQWVGIYHYDYAAGRFTQAFYSLY